MSEKMLTGKDITDSLILFETRKKVAGLWYLLFDWSAIIFSFFAIGTMLIQTYNWIKVVVAILSISFTISNKLFNQFAKKKNGLELLMKHNTLIFICLLFSAIFTTKYLIEQWINILTGSNSLKAQGSLSYAIFLLSILTGILTGYLLAQLLLSKSISPILEAEIELK